MCKIGVYLYACEYVCVCICGGELYMGVWRDVSTCVDGCYTRAQGYV